MSMTSAVQQTLPDIGPAPAPLLEAALTLVKIKYFVVTFPVAHHTAAVITLVGRCAAVEVQSKDCFYDSSRQSSRAVQMYFVVVKISLCNILS